MGSDEGGEALAVGLPDEIGRVVQGDELADGRVHEKPPNCADTTNPDSQLVTR